MDAIDRAILEGIINRGKKNGISDEDISVDVYNYLTLNGSDVAHGEISDFLESRGMPSIDEDDKRLEKNR